MNFLKVTRNGQVTIPKSFRGRFKADYYICEVKEDTIIFKPVEMPKSKKRTPYTMGDLKAFSFKAKNPKEKSISSKIDKFLYHS